MPISPYSGQIFSGYAVGRPYAGTLSSNYYTSPNSSLSFAHDKAGFRATSPAKNAFLSGNTAALAKTFAESSRAKDNSTSVKKYNRNTAYSYGRKDGNDMNSDTSSKSKISGSSNDEKVQNTDTYSQPDKKPKPIYVNKINLSDKVSLYSSASDTNEEDKLTRNRQVVRLTIKREKDKDKNRFPDNSVKTIAQKLFEKYTLPEKAKEDPYAHVPKSKLALHVNAAKQEPRKIYDKPPNLPLPPSAKSLLPKESSEALARPVIKNEDDGNEGDDELSGDDESESDKDVATKCFARATMDDTINKELKDLESVKDAIVAAILHPAVDIESDEEIKQLINSESNEGSRTNSKKKKKSKEVKKIDPHLLAKRRTSDAEIGGEMIVDKLKRYVKNQESLKNASRRPSRDVDDLFEIGGSSTLEENALSLQDKKALEKEGKSKLILNLEKDKDGEKESSKKVIKVLKKKKENQNKNNNPDSPNLETSSPLKEEENVTKNNDQKTLNKSFEPVCQTTHREDSVVLSSKGVGLLSGDHSITHPENKLPGAPSFITDSPSGCSETRREFLSLQSASREEKEKIEEEKKRTKDSLKGIAARKIIINDNETNLGKGEDKNQDEFQSQLDNSIKEESFNLKKAERTKNIDPKELKSNYRRSKGEKGKECKDTTQMKSGKLHLDGESSVAHSKDDTRTTKERTTESSSGEERNTLGGRFNKEEIRDNEDNGGHPFQVKGMLINCQPEESRWEIRIEAENLTDKNDKNVEKRKENDLEFEDFSLPRQVLAKSKRAFLKSLVSKDFKEDSNGNSEKAFDLKKSATTNIFQDSPFDFKVEYKPFNDAESLSLNSLQDFEIKPSLKQFLEEAKEDMNKEAEEDLDDLRNCFEEENKQKLTIKDENANRQNDKSDFVAGKNDMTTNLFPHKNFFDKKVKEYLNDAKGHQVPILKCLSDPQNLVEKSNAASEECTNKQIETINKKENVEKNKDEEKVSLQILKVDPALKFEENDAKNIEQCKPFKKSPTSKEKPHLIDELLNAKNVFKKPEKIKEEHTAQPKNEKSPVAVAELKKAWKRPVISKTAASKPVEDLAKACAALKRPAVNKTPFSKQQQDTLKKKEPQFAKSKTENQKTEVQIVKNELKVNASEIQFKISESSTQDDSLRTKKDEQKILKEEVQLRGNELKENLKRNEPQTQKVDTQTQKLNIKIKKNEFQSKIGQEETSKGNNLQAKIDELSSKDKNPVPDDTFAKKESQEETRKCSQSPDNFVKEETAKVEVRTESVKHKNDESSSLKTHSEKETSGKMVVALSPSQSADSAYGSSPSTPQPRNTAEREPKRANNGKLESEEKEDTENNERNANENKEICDCKFLFD